MAVGFAVALIPFFVPSVAITSPIGLIIGLICIIVLVVIVCYNDNETLCTFMFVLMSFLTGSVIAHTVMFVGVQITTIVFAIVLTIIMFIGLVLYAIYYGRNFAGMGGFLFTSLLLIVAASILNLFLNIAWVGVLIAYVGVLVFSGFIMYDTRSILHGNGNTARNALSMFLNVINLFLHVLSVIKS